VVLTVAILYQHIKRCAAYTCDSILKTNYIARRRCLSANRIASYPAEKIAVRLSSNPFSTQDNSIRMHDYLVKTKTQREISAFRLQWWRLQSIRRAQEMR
jgi:hypothetical protein